MWGYYGALVVLIPFLFSLKSTISKFLGELSYPVYITHFFIIKLLIHLPWHLSLPVFLLLVLLMTGSISLGLYRYVDRPIDKLRQGRLHKVHLLTKK